MLELKCGPRAATLSLRAGLRGLSGSSPSFFSNTNPAHIKEAAQERPIELLVASGRAVSPTLHRRVLRQPPLLDVINIRLAQPGPLGRHRLIREPERDHLGDGAVQRPVDIRLLQPPRSQVLSDVPTVVAATASRERCWLASWGEQIDVLYSSKPGMKTCSVVAPLTSPGPSRRAVPLPRHAEVRCNCAVPGRCRRPPRSPRRSSHRNQTSSATPHC